MSSAFTSKKRVQSSAAAKLIVPAIAENAVIAPKDIDCVDIIGATVCFCGIGAVFPAVGKKKIPGIQVGDTKAFEHDGAAAMCRQVDCDAAIANRDGQIIKA